MNSGGKDYDNRNSLQDGQSAICECDQHQTETWSESIIEAQRD